MKLTKKKNTLATSTRIINFFKSLYNHIRTGMKKSSTSQIRHRYEICQGCEFFNFISRQDEIKATCNVCGCNLSDKKIFMNKLAWKDQQCPKGKW